MSAWERAVQTDVPGETGIVEVEAFAVGVAEIGGQLVVALEIGGHTYPLRDGAGGHREVAVDADVSVGQTPDSWSSHQPMRTNWLRLIRMALCGHHETVRWSYPLDDSSAFLLPGWTREGDRLWTPRHCSTCGYIDADTREATSDLSGRSELETVRHGETE